MSSLASVLRSTLRSTLIDPLARAVTEAGVGGFNPVSQFSSGQKGWVYDFNDLSTLFADSAGTTPASVNGAVGLVLDKRLGLALGTEVIPQPLDLASASWSTAGTLSTVTANGFINTSGAGAGRSLAITTGRWYRFSVTYTKSDSSTLFGVYDNSSATPLSVSTAASGTLSGIYLANGPFYLRIAGNASVTVSSVSLREVAGNHASQASASSRPTLRGTPTGANLASGATWTAGTGWSVAGDTATATTSSGTLTAAAVTATVGKFYRITWTLTRTAGSVTASFGGRSGAARSASGTYVGYFDNTTNTNALVFTGSGFSGTVTLNTIELVDVSVGSVTAPYGLQFDGVDDFLQTASIDFSASDEMFVCVGVRKLSDSTQGIVFEHTASLTGNNGAFYLSAPNSAANNFAFASKGTIAATDTESGFTAPFTAVLSGLGDISGDSALLRINGVAGTAATTDQGTGNFANAAVYIGRRGGTTLPFNGILFSSVCRGGTLPDAAGISNNERWVAQRTGVTL